MNPLAVPKRTQLLQTLGTFQPAGSPGYEVGEKACPVGIDSNMTAIGHAGRKRSTVPREVVPRPRQWRTAEGQRQAIDVAEHLDHIGVEQGLVIIKRHGLCSVSGIRVLL